MKQYCPYCKKNALSLVKMLKAASGSYGTPCPECGTRIRVPPIYCARSAAPLLFFAISMTVGYPNRETEFEFFLLSLMLCFYLIVTSKVSPVDD